MYKSEKKIVLQDLIDVEFLQNFQDSLAQAMDIGSLITDNQKAITKPSNFSNFCTNLIRKSSIGCKNCNDCDLKWGNIAANQGKPVIYTCHAGLTDFAVPIIVDDIHLGSIFGGQVLTEMPTEEKFLDIANRLKIDTNDYLKEISKVKIVPLEKIEQFANLLFIVANTLSEIAHKNLELKRQNRIESLSRKITEAIRKTLDIKETKQSIVNIIGEALNADKCLIAEYDNKNNKFLRITDEYLSSSDVIHYTDNDVNIDVPNFSQIIISGNSFIINNKEIITNSNIKDFSCEKKHIENHKINSVIAMPLFYNDELLGGLWVQYNNENRSIENADVELLKILSNQIAIALHQSSLYRLTQLHAEREKINRNIIEILTSTLDKDSIKNLFVQNIGEYFNADRVLFSEYDEITHMFIPADKSSEYLSNENEKSFINFDWNDKSSNEFIYPLLNKKEFNIPNWNKFIKETKVSNEFKMLMEDANVKSSYNIPVLYTDKLMGFFCIEFTHQFKELTYDDLTLVRGISKQAAIAMHHAQLYIRAEESSRAKGEFIANMSHEIKTPLNIIIGFSEIMSEMQLDRKKQVEYLNNINISGKHLLALTNDIINISKIDSGNICLNYEDINIQNLIMDMINTINILAKNKNIEIFQKTEKIEMKADPKMLNQIMYNLLSNAIKFTHQNGKIIVKAETIGDELVISIEDNGIGIPKEDFDKIFEEFRQVDSSYARRQEGAGLGLAITKKLIELHNGEIHVESSKDKGSKFWFTLPLNTFKMQIKPKQLV